MMSLSGVRAIVSQIPPKPDWLKVRLPSGPTYARVRRTLQARGLHTVCEEARCPNVGECWGSGTATFMVLGDTCTRACRFCAVKSGRPEAVDPEEPEKVAGAVGDLGLSYVVLTMVTRDDLPDGGAEHLARCVERLKARHPAIRVEVLASDLGGDAGAVERVVRSRPDVFAHNLETTRSLTPHVRDPRTSYERSLQVLALAKRLDPSRPTKSSLSLGLGESEADVRESLGDLRDAGVALLTLGQYLQPSPRHHPVIEYLPPSRFAAYRALAELLGFQFVASDPFVRSSYRAGEVFVEGVLRQASGGKPQP
jgi:lipoic acid synthetase